MHDKIRRLRSKEASDYLNNEWGVGRSHKTLAKYAVTGGGPDFQKDGRYRIYTPENLDAYARSVLSPVVNSTAELKVAREAKCAVTTSSSRPIVAGAAEDSSPSADAT